MLPAIVTQLEQLIAQVNASGPVATEKARIDVSTHAKSGYNYARLRSNGQLKSCGRVGSETYLDALSMIQRRDKIAQLTTAIEALKRADAIPVVLSKSRVMVTSVKSDTNALDVQPKLSPAITQAEVKAVTSARQSKAKAKGRKKLYTRVKTKQGSVIHAVLGKDKVGEWRIPALCGATPPLRDRMGWEFPVHDDGVSCSKCYRKLPANGQRHFPQFG